MVHSLLLQSDSVGFDSSESHVKLIFFDFIGTKGERRGKESKFCFPLNFEMLELNSSRLFSGSNT